MFDKISLDEVCQKMKEYDKKIKEFKAQGAVVYGDRGLDKQYTGFLAEVTEYIFQFSEDECYAIMGKCAREAEFLENK